MKDPYQLNKVPLIVECNNHTTPNRQKISCHFRAMEEQIIDSSFLSFPFFWAHLASLWYNFSPPFKLIYHQNASPHCFLSKKSHVHRYLVILNHDCRKRLSSSLDYSELEMNLMFFLHVQLTRKEVSLDMLQSQTHLFLDNKQRHEIIWKTRQCTSDQNLK